MDALALLHRAQEAGLRVELIGDKLLVRGPKRAEAVVKLLGEYRGGVPAALAAGASVSKCDGRRGEVDATEARRWHDRLGARIAEWHHGDRDWEAAKRLAWGDLENEWHFQHGKR